MLPRMFYGKKGNAVPAGDNEYLRKVIQMICCDSDNLFR